MAIKTKGLVPRTWRWLKRILIFLFFLHIFYLLILKWVNPPVTLTQLSSFIHGDGLKRGASTISQQVAKNVFLWQGRSWMRKALEAYFTFMIEKLWGKKRILQMYLNVSEMGKGVFGIEAAAKVYFNKHARTLTRSESAMIAGCLPNPRLYTIKPLSRHVSMRYPWILTQMNHLQDDPDIIKLLQ